MDVGATFPTDGQTPVLGGESNFQAEHKLFERTGHE